MIFDGVHGRSFWRDIVVIISLFAILWLMHSYALWVGNFMLFYVFLMACMGLLGLR